MTSKQIQVNLEGDRQGEEVGAGSQEEIHLQVEEVPQVHREEKRKPQAQQDTNQGHLKEEPREAHQYEKHRKKHHFSLSKNLMEKLLTQNSRNL